MRTISVVCVLALLAAPELFAQDRLPEVDVRLPADAAAEISRFLSRAVQNGTVPAVEAVVATRDGVLYHEAFGVRNRATSTPLEKGDVFRIASMTKAITSAAVMILHEEGKIDLNAPGAIYLPVLAEASVLTEFRARDSTFSVTRPGNPVTVHQLLNNTSGIAYSWWDERLPMIAAKLREEYPTDELYLRLPLFHEPGTRWTYGPSTRALGEIISEVTGQGLEDVLRDRIFAPLGMHETFYSVPEEELHRRVTLHVKDNGSFVEQPLPESGYRRADGDGGLASTARDFVTFLRMLLRGGELDGTRILSESSVDVMTSNQIGDLSLRQLFRGFPAEAAYDKFGYGFQIATERPETTTQRSEGSYGWSGGFNTFFWADPMEGIAAVLFMQFTPAMDPAAQRLNKEFEHRVYEGLSRQSVRR